MPTFSRRSKFVEHDQISIVIFSCYAMTLLTRRHFLLLFFVSVVPDNREGDFKVIFRQKKYVNPSISISIPLRVRPLLDCVYVCRWPFSGAGKYESIPRRAHEWVKISDLEYSAPAVNLECKKHSARWYTWDNARPVQVRDNNQYVKEPSSTGNCSAQRHYHLWIEGLSKFRDLSGYGFKRQTLNIAAKIEKGHGRSPHLQKL